MSKIYLDYNATTPMKARAKSALLEALSVPLNASSVHAYGRHGRKLVEDARVQVAALVGAAPAQVIFNSGATEGNNTVLQFFARRYPQERILISAVEHLSVRDALSGFSEAGEKAEDLPVTADGVLHPDALRDALSDKSAGRVSLVSVMAANNETGVIQPIADIAEIVHSHGAFLHVDAVQAAGKMPVDIATMGADFMTISAHKIGGAQGAGALVLGNCGITPVLLYGGGQEKKTRAGTENIPAITAFGVAADIARSDIESGAYQAHIAGLHDALQASLWRLEKQSGRKIIQYGAGAPRLINTILFSIAGVRAESVLMALDMDGIAVSNGSACSSGSVQYSHVLEAMGVAAEKSGGAVRISMGMENTLADIESFEMALRKILRV